MCSHTGRVLLAISWSFILFVVITPFLKQPMFVVCVLTAEEVYWQTWVDHTYPIWTVIMWGAHIPSILLTQGVTESLQKILSLSCAPTAKLELAVFFFFSSLQWLLVGYGGESFVKLMRSRKNQRRIEQALGADSP